jgi:hypothetical protein
MVQEVGTEDLHRDMVFAVIGPGDEVAKQLAFCLQHPNEPSHIILGINCVQKVEGVNGNSGFNF